MNKVKSVAALSLLGLALSACASGGSGVRVELPSENATEIEGTLVEARCYFNTGAIGGDHTFCAFRSAKGNLPLGVLTSRGEFIFLTSAPAAIAGDVAMRVRVRGYLTANRQLLKPATMAVAARGAWTEVDL